MAPDTVEVEAFDANGNEVYGPVDVSYTSGQDLVLNSIPMTANGIQLDYLRDESIVLFRSEFAMPTAQPLVVNPNTTAPDEQATSYAYVPSGTGFKLVETVSGVRVNTLPTTVSPGQDNLFLKGVCYSPAPINYSNKDAPAFGDLFWDTHPNPNDSTQKIFNWQGLWNKGPLGYMNFQGRDDLNRIRALNCNSLRTYCTIARQINNDGSVPAPSTGTLFTHKQFLDLCWNKGNHPLRVMIGIPMPSFNYYSYAKDTTNYQFWEANLRDTIAELGNHPAVLGFCIFNETDEDRSAWPHVNGQLNSYTPNVDIDYYYGQIKRYSAIVKSLAPGKLVGWAAHEAPNLRSSGGLKTARAWTWTSRPGFPTSNSFPTSTSTASTPTRPRITILSSPATPNAIRGASS